MGALHRLFRALLPKLFFGEPGYDDRQLVGRKPVGVVQDGGDGQVLAAHRAVDDHLKALHRGEGVNSPPVAARAIVIEN